ncbi:MAG: sensor histidine kinase, partial [Planctomycetota bacterium]
AMKEKSVIEDPQGVAVPVMADGELRGGAYFLFREARNVEWSPIGLLITFIASTVLLTGAVGYLISTSVVKPVEHLADVSWRIAHGDLAAEPRPDANDDEIGNLTQSTVAMLQTLRAHRRDLEIACDEAAERAKKAERELLRTQRLASMGTLAAGIAHEINNPLGGLLNAVRVLREGKLPPDRREEYYELVLEGLERIQGIVGRVLTMAPRTGVHSEVALAEAARDAAALAEHRARKLGITIDTEFTENGGTILGNRGELVQVFLNIILNSIDSIEERQHSEPGYEGGSIRIAVRETGNEVVATVRDTGNGLDSAIAERVFDPFFTTKEQSKGSGLGLAVVFGIVQNHRGTVLLRPATTQPADGERGCEVVMRFPRSNVLA